MQSLSQWPTCGFDLHAMGSAGVFCMESKDDCIPLSTSIKWQQLSFKEQERFNAEYERRFVIPFACSIPQLVSALGRWHIHVSSMTGGANARHVVLNLPRKSALSKVKPKWHTRGWENLLEWCKTHPWKQAHGFYDKLMQWHLQYTMATVDNEWNPPSCYHKEGIRNKRRKTQL
jgi:hypothetical protein